MNYQTLISTNELNNHLDDPDWAIVDCRFLLAEPDRCEADYLEAHIPGAIYAHLDRDLSAKVIPGKTSRHPLPTVEQTTSVFSRMGIGPGVQVVAYDDMGGALAAVRLWWMLRWLGHEAAAVLDGDWSKWLKEGRPTEKGMQQRTARPFSPKPRPEIQVDAGQVERMRQDPEQRVFDARAPERYRGDVEPIDPVAGHIPGAINLPYEGNLTAEGTMKSPDELRKMYRELLEDVPAENAAFYCGSGVTSIHNILAILHAGMGEARLYAGSWSEWITDPNRPITKGL